MEGALKIPNGHLLLKKIWFFVFFFSQSKWLAIYGKSLKMCNLSFYTSLNYPHSSRIKTHSATQESKSCRSQKSSFHFSNKCNKGPITSNKRPKNFLVQRSGFRPKWSDIFAQQCCQSHYLIKVDDIALFHDKISQFGVLNHFPRWLHRNAKLSNYYDLNALFRAKKIFGRVFELIGF